MQQYSKWNEQRDNALKSVLNIYTFIKCTILKSSEKKSQNKTKIYREYGKIKLMKDILTGK